MGLVDRSRRSGLVTKPLVCAQIAGISPLNISLNGCRSLLGPEKLHMWRLGSGTWLSEVVVVQFADVVHTKNPRPVEPTHASTLPKGLYHAVFKRLFDLILVAALLPVALPVVAILALLVGRDGHNPFYFQPRIGRGGRVFTMVKLRTMVPNAEDQLNDHLVAHPEAAAQWERKQKLEADPRITPLGAVLRRISVDELPQIWNVLLGHMSLVGPRPMMVDQQRLYPGKDYYNLRPGITGLWQVSERHGSEFVSRAEYDREYAATVSLGTDLGVLVRTVAVVLRATGI